MTYYKCLGGIFMAKEDFIINKNNIIDDRTSYGKGLVENNNFRIYREPAPIYIGDDGKEYGTIKAVKIANKIYWDSMKINTSYKDFAQQSEEKKGRSR